MTGSSSHNDWSEPSRYAVPAQASITDDLMARVATSPDHPVFARKTAGEWRTVTCREFADQATALAAGLVAAGVAPGDRIAIMSETRYEWVLCDFAIWLAAAVSVPVYETSAPEQVAWLLADSGARGMFVANASMVPDGLPGPLDVWSIVDGDLDALAARGNEIDGEELDRRRHAITADSPATIVYTSGTTGRPKGCVLHHRNLIAQAHDITLADGVGDIVLTERTSILLFLPLAHILTRVVQLAALLAGALTAHTADLANLPEALSDFRPTLLVGVPRVYQKLHDAAARTAASTGRGALFRAAEGIALAYSHSLDTGGPGWPLRVAHRLFDRVVYTRVRDAVGGRVRYAVSGGAPLQPRLAHFLRGAGIVVLEGWGLTETTAGVTLNLPAAQRIGSVGRPLPGWSVRIASDGEVLVRGGGVLRGYWRQDGTVDDVRDAEGWFHTGDLGELDDGYLTIVGRKKDLIVTASGKNVTPAFLEGRLTEHWLIDQCVLVGDDRPYIGALLILDQDGFADWKSRNRRPSGATVAQLCADAELNAVLQHAVDEANRLVSRAEAIKRFRVLPGQFDVGRELTTTQNVRRQHVIEKFHADVEALYRRPGE